MGKENKWYLQNAQDQEIVISTRIRLARNLKRFPFKNKMSVAQKEQLNEIVKQALSKLQMGNNNFRYLKLSELHDYEMMALAERHLISYDLVQNRDHGLVALSEDDSISVMVNEEDHIRIQVMQAGLKLKETLEVANRIDDFLDLELDYAFDEYLGYLTACPTNLGTGLRASVLMHFPVLEQTGALRGLMNSVGKVGLTIRGSYGEGTEVQGSVYNISNQITLGISEQLAAENLEAVIQQLLERERSAREEVKHNPNLINQIWRSYGLLRYASMLSYEEFSDLVSNMRLGIAIGLIVDISLADLSRMIAQSGPAALCEEAGKQLSTQERDLGRARMIKQIIN